MKNVSKNFDLLLVNLQNATVGTDMKSIIDRFKQQTEEEVFIKRTYPTNFEQLFSLLCITYRSFDEKVQKLTNYVIETDNQTDNAIMMSALEVQQKTLETLRIWIKSLCQIGLKFFDNNDQVSDKLVSLVVIGGTEQLKRYVGYCFEASKAQGADVIDVLKSQKNISTSQILPDLSMEDLLSQLNISFTGLGRFLKRLARQDLYVEDFLEDEKEVRKQQQAKAEKANTFGWTSVVKNLFDRSNSAVIR